ncbi:NYN domain-containing protein [Variovorax sp. PAMC 28711]|uniref:NYN domain-containing protein n=1 Tax=Variovorax sp. PAMC 28711 TaxID=1795631 RepID=UPI00078BC6AF|nr:NYN domain-containing protein [Variovorax sp. PAMC 28711]AMM24158.1 NYN domain-containing protein [Variovorax sp. PAMC 28711]
MTPTLRVMLLIDADNVSSDVIEQAVQRTLTEHGAVHVRRAYCNAETAVKQQALFKRLSVRPMVNISAGKNSTDIALAVDAVDLVIAERPDVVVLVSSDSDFAPLVIRLREKGCRVCGIGQQGKTGEETVGVYDEFTDLAHHGVRGGVTPAAASAPATAAARKTRARPAAKTAAAKTAPAAKKTSRSAAAKKTSRSAAAKKTAPKPKPPSEAAEFILQAVPALRSGKEVALNDAAQALRAAGLLGKHGSSLKLFDKLTAEFAVLQHPDRIRWTGAPAA